MRIANRESHSPDSFLPGRIDEVGRFVLRTVGCIELAFEHGFCGDEPRIASLAGLVTAERIDESRYKIRLNDITVRKNNVYTEFEGHRYLVD